MAAATAGWGLSYDAAVFLPLPALAELEADARRGAGWIAEAIAHYGGDALTDGDRAALTAAGTAMLQMAEPFVTQLWFAPPGVYSDVLVTIAIADAGSESAATLEKAIVETASATAEDAIAIETDRLGSGVLYRRTVGVPVDDGSAALMAHWELGLRSSDWVVAVTAMGTTLPVFALLEEALPGLLDGIELP